MKRLLQLSRRDDCSFYQDCDQEYKDGFRIYFANTIKKTYMYRMKEKSGISPEF
jgi:hypothetical protein